MMSVLCFLYSVFLMFVGLIVRLGEDMLVVICL
jgi:hypothetical protein